MKKIKDITLDEWNMYFDYISSQEELDEKINSLSELERAEIMFHFPEIEETITDRTLLMLEHNGKEFSLELMEADPKLRGKAILLRTPAIQWIFPIKHHLKSRMTDNQVIIDEVRRVYPKTVRVKLTDKDVHSAVMGVLEIFLHRWEDIAARIYGTIKYA